MRARSTGSRALRAAVLGLAALGGSDLDAQGTPPLRQAISREVTLGNTLVPPAEQVRLRQAFSREVTVAFPVADLGASAVVASPPEGLPGRPFTVSWQVRNVGPVTAAGGWVDRIHLSTDEQPGRDTLLGELVREGPDLAPGAVYELSLSATFPVASRQYWLIVETGLGSELGETNELNNVLVGRVPLRVLEPLEPDLVVLEVEGPAGAAFAGSTTEVSFVVSNQSANPTYVSGWMDGIFLVGAPALDPLLGREPHFLGQHPSPVTLPAGASYSQVASFTLPERLEGTFHIAVYTDARRAGGWRLGDPHDQPEEDEKNNWLFSAPFEVRASPLQPDLRPAGISFLPEASSSRAIDIAWSDENAGSAPTETGAWVDEVYLSADDAPAVGPQDRLLGRRVRSGAPLGAGEAAALALRVVLPADLAGTFRVKVAVDTNDAVWEPGREGNNVAVSSQPLTVFLSPAVDLTPASIDVPPAGFPGHALEVAWSVRNVGAPPLDLALSWRDALYLSRDTAWSPADDVLLGRFWRSTSRDASGRLALADYSRSASVLLPAGAPPGPHHLLVVVDEGDQLFEGTDAPGPADDGLKERNNVLASRAVDLRILSADLTIAAASPLPAAGRRLESLRLSWRVVNAGALGTPVSSWTDAVYLSSDESLDARDILLASAARSGELAAGESYTAERAAVVPAVLPGSYFLLLATDAHDRVLELPPGEGNNAVASPFTVTGEGPDLAIDSVRLPSSARAGGQARIEWTGANRGTAAIERESWSDRVYLSADGVADASDVLLGSQSRSGPLEPGGMYTASASFELPPSAGGLLEVIVVADGAGSILESDESNNSLAAAAPLNVEPLQAPNLVVRSVVVAGPAVSGQTVEVSWTVDNAGSGPTLASSWSDAAFLSRDRYLDASFDYFLGAKVHLGALGPGESYVSGGVFDLPPGTSGPFFVFVVADRGASAFEGVVVDNQAASDDSFQVTLPSPSDLEVVEVLLPASGRVGSPLRIEWRIANVGGSVLQGRWTDAVFLSRDETLDLDDVHLGSFPSVLDVPLAPGESVRFAVEARVPGLLPGAYRAIVRADALNQMPDSQDANDVKASAGTTEIAVPRLELDAPPITIRLAAGEEQLFEVEAAAAEAVGIALEHSSGSAWTELYSRRGAVPSPGIFDVRFEGVGQPRQAITIPDATGGRHYVLVRAARGTFSPGGEEATLLARTLPFAVDSASPRRIGDAGRATISVRGSRFSPDVEVFLADPGGDSRAALHVARADGANLRATFVLDGIQRGEKDLLVRRPDGTEARLAGGIEVEAVSPPLLEVPDPDPPALREGPPGGALELVATNRGNVDAEYVYLAALIARLEGVEIVEARSSNGPVEPLELGALAGRGALIRSLAPGERASLRVTVRAGAGSEGQLPIGVGAVLLDTRAFLGFADGAAEALRSSLLGDPGLAAAESSAVLLEAAQDEGAWRRLWRERLVAAGRLSPADRDAAGGAGGIAGHTRCAVSAAAGAADLAALRDEGLLCASWLAGLASGAAAALGVLPGAVPEAASRPACDPASLVGCLLARSWEVKRSIDPNEKTGSDGIGDEAHVPADRPIRYRIHFENLAAATGPAAVVRITDPLDPGLNPASVRLGDIAFGDTIVRLPPETIFFQERRPLDFAPGLALDVVAGVDALRSEAFWILRTVDRGTGLVPTNANLGFLAVSDGSGQGRGWVELSVVPSPTQEEEVIIRNEACIIFDSNEPLETNSVLRTLDARAPESRIASLPATSDGSSLPLSWSGTDAAPGSGLASFTIHVSRDGGLSEPWLVDTTAESASFPVEPGHRYAFHSIARDHAGNEEAAPEVPDAETIARGGALFRRGDASGDGLLNITDAIFLLGHLFLGGIGPPCLDAADANDDVRADISDAVFVLAFLFLGGPPPPAPGPAACGADPTPDGFGACEDPGRVCAP